MKLRHNNVKVQSNNVTKIKHKIIKLYKLGFNEKYQRTFVLLPQ